MKSQNLNSLPALLIIFFMTISSEKCFAQESLNIATFNIRYDNPGDEGNLWKDRSPHLINLIRFHQIDLFGTQEGMVHQLKDIQKELDFPYIGIGRDQGDDKGEFSAVFYNPRKLELLDKGNFWLSETPDKASKGWDAALNRICSWGKFKSDNMEFYVFNIHFDHIGQKAREESSKLIVKKIEELNAEKLPTVLMGDFNVEDDNPAYAEVLKSGWLKDAKEESQIPPYGPEGTFTGFNWDQMPDKRIDYIFVSPEFEVIRYGVLSDNYGKKYPSDHFPVFAELGLKED